MSKVSLPHKFKSGGLALASEMNDNFDTLASAHNELDEKFNKFKTQVLEILKEIAK